MIVKITSHIASTNGPVFICDQYKSFQRLLSLAQIPGVVRVALKSHHTIFWNIRISRFDSIVFAGAAPAQDW